MSTFNEDKLNQKIADLKREISVHIETVHRCNAERQEYALENGSLRKSVDSLRAERDGWNAKFEAHTEAVGRFVAEMYAIMIDPLESAEQNVKDTCAALIEQAKQDRESLIELHEWKTGKSRSRTDGLQPK